MRVNSYNKFFTEVAKIMNTDVKSVKPIEGRYKVELTNHVCLNVYRGVSGSLFIHDHRGIAHITSCYDFDDFKTVKDLYERLITDYSESTNAETVTQPSEESIKDTIIADDNIAYQTAKVTKTKHSVIDAMQCLMCSADREGNRCGGKQWCKQTWKRYDAIVNPEWHHVSIATLANIDNDMLDEKRQRYFKIYKELIKTIRDLCKCKTAATYQIRWWKFKQVIADDIYYNGTTVYMTRFLDAKISMCNVECGLWPSVNEKATSFIKSRRYCSTTLK